MIHYGKNPQGELEIRVTGDDIQDLGRLIEAALTHRQTPFRDLREYIRQEFGDAGNDGQEQTF